MMCIDWLKKVWKVKICGYCSLNSAWTVTASLKNVWKKKGKNANALEISAIQTQLISIFGCIRNYLLTVIVHPVTIHICHYLCEDSVTVQTLFTQRFCQKILELLLTFTVRHYSLLCRIVFFHCALYYYEYIVHLLFFPLLYAYIYGFCMS